MTIKLTGPKNEAATSEICYARWPVMSENKEEDFDPDQHPAAHRAKNQHSGAVAASPGPMVGWLER